MSKQPKFPDPFAIAKQFADLDPTKIMEEFGRAFGAYEQAGMDINAILASQRKNLETLREANQRAMAGMQAIAERQQELLQQTMRETTQALKALSSSGSPQEAIAKQTELMQSAFAQATSNMREFAEMVAKANREVVETINKRIAETVAEGKTAAAKSTE